MAIKITKRQLSEMVRKEVRRQKRKLFEQSRRNPFAGTPDLEDIDISELDDLSDLEQYLDREIDDLSDDQLSDIESLFDDPESEDYDDEDYDEDEEVEYDYEEEELYR